MNEMFYNAKGFNKDYIINWDISGVENGQIY